MKRLKIAERKNKEKDTRSINSRAKVLIFQIPVILGWSEYESFEMQTTKTQILVQMI